MYIEFLPGEKHAGKQADTSDTMDTFKDCGYLIEENEVILDFDDVPRSLLENMIAWFKLDTETVWTDRGCHLYFTKPEWFKRPKKNMITALGIPCEMKTSTTTPNGITRKRNGVEREVSRPGKRMDLPKIFDPYPSKTKYRNLMGMNEGEGRNEALHNHKLALKNCQGWESILRFINNYVFADPLPEEEYKAVARTESVTQQETEDFMVASKIITDYRCVVYSGSIWFYDGSEYVTDEKNSRLIRIIYQRCQGQNTRFIDEVQKQIAYRSPIIPGDKVFPIRFENGVLLPTGVFVEDDEYYEFTPYYININYIKDAKPLQVVDDYIDSLTSGDESYKALLMEVLAYVLIVDPERIRSIGKFFMFRGDGANGKGTLLQIMKKIYNEKNCTSLSIKQLADDRFKVTMIDKLANLGDDIEPEAINNDQLKILKNITTADTVATRKLYSESQNATFTTKLYFTTNSDIKSFEKGYAYKRRILWLPMFNKVEKPDPRFITRITTDEALEYWISLIMEGYFRLYQNQAWTECEIVNEYNEHYHEENNLVMTYLKACDPDAQLIGKNIRDIKEDYKVFAGEEYNATISTRALRQGMWDLYKIGLGVKKNGNETVRVCMRQEDTKQNLKP